jgi:hypothetical protein
LTIGDRSSGYFTHWELSSNYMNLRENTNLKAATERTVDQGKIKNKVTPDEWHGVCTR